jgi:hypothetical protein
VLGIDRPVYVNVHSHFAQRLARYGGAMVHVVRYLRAQSPGTVDEAEAHQALDCTVPGWRDEVADERFLPGRTVMHDTPTAHHGGLGGRRGPMVPGVAGLAVAGDWVGACGILADAALASAEQAARLLSSAPALEGAT